MKKVIFSAVILLITFLANILTAQTDCKVLLPAIAGNYAGNCKKGLADGIGQATGEDFYKGEFVKGLPEGKGIYTWKNGATYNGEWKRGMRNGNGVYSYKFQNTDSVLEGVWKEDRYLGKKALSPYEIEYRTGIGRVSCVRTGDRPYIKYVFSRNGLESNNISGLLLQGSSGTENLRTEFTGFESVKFPFHGNVRFFAPNNFYASTLSCELRLTINKPGAWIVTIFY